MARAARARRPLAPLTAAPPVETAGADVVGDPAVEEAGATTGTESDAEAEALALELTLALAIAEEPGAG
jgi:hypothetical protein